MRICLYTDTAMPKLGGQEVVVDALARQFQKLGLEVKVLAPRPRYPLRPDDERLPYPVIRHPRFYSTHAFVAWYRWWLRRLWQSWPFDLLHCHGVYPPSYLASLLQLSQHVPVVVTSHGGDVHPGSVRLARPVVRRRVQQGLQAADALVAISRVTRENYRRLCPQAPRIVFIPNGVDLELYSQATARPAELDAAIRPGEYFLFLGRLAPRKGVDLALQALALLPRANYVRLVIAGDGDVRGDLEAQCIRLGLQNQVRFVGPTFPPLKTYLLQNALCLVMPSRISEAFPLVVLESFAAGKPVLATRIPGLEELIEPGETGWLIPENDPPALALVLQQALRRRAEVEAMGENARRSAQQHGWPAIAQMHIALYQDLLAQRQHARAG
jgi:glycosyltransferase involved in cell wall biosynthesis